MGYNKFAYQTADPLLYGVLRRNAEYNRKHPTEAESTMWKALKDSNLGVRFRRQHIIGDYIADFVCIEKGVIIEIDGDYHQQPEQTEGDKVRTTWLNANGFDVLRFSNEDVLGDIDNVIEVIQKYIND